MGSWRPHRRAPVSEVQNGLDGVPTTCGDVTFKTGKQGQKHVDSEALPLPGKGGVRGVISPQSPAPPIGFKSHPQFPPLASPPYLWAFRILSTISSPTLLRTVRPSEQLMKN